MEQARLFIAIGISFLIFFLWSMFFAPKPPEKPAEVTQTNSQTQEAPSQAQSPVVPQDTTADTQEPVAVATPATAARQIQVETPLYGMTLSEKGGAVTSLVLKEYHESIGKDSPLKELIHKEAVDGTLLLALSGADEKGLEQAMFGTDFKGDILTVSDQAAQIKFQHRTASGLIVEKIYKFSPDTYMFDLIINILNGSGQPYQGQLSLELQNTLPKDSGRYAFEGPSGLINNSLEQIAIKKIKDNNNFSGVIDWVAIEDRYFMTSIIPEKPVSGRMQLVNGDKTIKNELVTDIDPINPGQSNSKVFRIFMGPKSLSLLKSFNCKLDRAINFGWFDFLAKPCLWFMNFIYGFIPNYGVAIILLTIISRGIFWPLAKKSYKSMGEMRRLQPLMQEIREKYKDDKTKMNQEMMALYRTYKVNPMGGCLPMLIQLPVFFALYRMLYSAIELRHAPFFGWITDLSAPDRLFHFSFKIPFMDPPYGIPVLTLIMGATMLIQQKMTPQAGDPTQAKMMMLMPLIFTFIFINFSSGLVLYWLVSNIFSIAQQYYTQKQTA